MIGRRVGLFIAGATAAAASFSVARVGAWTWVRVAPDEMDGWIVRHGTAEVSWSGRRLHAELKEAEALANFILDGVLNGSQVSAIERQLHSDVATNALRAPSSVGSPAGVIL